MHQNITKQKQAIIILHEIYGKNTFMDELCNDFQKQGYVVICPDMLQRLPFSYEDAEDAYRFFQENVGFEYYKQVEQLIEQVKKEYEKVMLLGFSVGATIAWRCCESQMCDGIFSCYGSRIRDYVSLQPRCPVCLLFASQDSFDVEAVIQKISDKPNITLALFEAEHGFMDPYGAHYNQKQAEEAKKILGSFLGDSCADFSKGSR